ncbi:MAG: alkaline phosphatase family protein, partial [Steroidobacteraceae bacterium]
RKGERLVKQVYESLRASRFWGETMLIVTFDEHGGFLDHVPPPAAVTPGGDVRYADAARPFAFDRLGVRVPAVVVSAYTQRNTVVGTSPQEIFDHTSILATVQKRFGLRPITQRDAAARTLEAALNSTSARLSAVAAPLTLPEPAGVRFASWLMAGFAKLLRRFTVQPAAPLSISQKVQLALAHACNLRILDATALPDAQRRFEAAHAGQDAAGYIQEVEARIRSRRASSLT